MAKQTTPSKSRTTSDELTRLELHFDPDTGKIRTDPPGYEPFFSSIGDLLALPEIRRSDGYHIWIQIHEERQKPKKKKPSKLNPARAVRKKAIRQAVSAVKKGHIRDVVPHTVKTGPRPRRVYKPPESRDTTARRQRRQRGGTPADKPSWTITEARAIARIMPARVRAKGIANHVLRTLDDLHKRGKVADPVTYLEKLVGKYIDWATGKSTIAIQNPVDWLNEVAKARINKSPLPTSAR